MNSWKMIDIDMVKVPQNFLNYEPKDKKLNYKRMEWLSNNGQPKPLLLNKECYLIDGYCQYILAKEFGLSKVGVTYNSKNYYQENRKTYKNIPTFYLFGKHKETDTKEYCWRIPASKNKVANKIYSGDVVFCQTKHGLLPVVVCSIKEFSEPPVKGDIKKVNAKYVIRDGIHVKL